MKKFNAKEIVIPTVVLFLIAAICTGILAFTNQITQKKIEENNIAAAQSSRLLVCPDAKSFSDEKTVDYKGGKAVYVEALDSSSSVIGYVFTTETKGYGGVVKIMTGIDKSGLVTGVQTLELSETAGLGMNAKKDSFRSQYVGNSGEFTVVKSGAGENEIQALTGATITSNAVTTAVNEAVGIYKTVTGGGK